MKITVFLAALLVGFTFTFTSCKKDSDPITAASPFQVYYLGATRDYSAETVMNLYPGEGYLLIKADQWGTLNTITMRANGVATGTYMVADSSDNYINMLKGSIKYTTQGPGGGGVITITKIDTSTHYATGTFSGSLIRISDPPNLIYPTDTINISNGLFNIKFGEM